MENRNTVAKKAGEREGRNEVNYGGVKRRIRPMLALRAIAGEQLEGGYGGIFCMPQTRKIKKPDKHLIGFITTHEPNKIKLG